MTSNLKEDLMLGYGLPPVEPAQCLLPDAWLNQIEISGSHSLQIKQCCDFLWKLTLRRYWLMWSHCECTTGRGLACLLTTLRHWCTVVFAPYVAQHHPSPWLQFFECRWGFWWNQEGSCFMNDLCYWYEPHTIATLCEPSDAKPCFAAFLTLFSSKESDATGC